MGTDGTLPVRDIIAARRGDPAAVARVVEWGLSRLSGRVGSVRREIEYRREHEWDAADARARAMAGDVPPAQTVGALSDLHRALIRVLAWTPAALLADAEDIEAVNQLWSDALMQLVLAVHNPTIKYGIIGGLDADLREDAEDYFARMERELWGTLEALSSDGPVRAADFPPETGAALSRVADVQQARGHAADEAARPNAADADGD